MPHLGFASRGNYSLHVALPTTSRAVTWMTKGATLQKLATSECHRSAKGQEARFTFPVALIPLPIESKRLQTLQTDLVEQQTFTINTLFG